MTTPALPRRPLEALIEQWRAKAILQKAVRGNYPKMANDLKDMATGLGYALGDCADELAALLRAADTEPAIRGGDVLGRNLSIATCADATERHSAGQAVAGDQHPAENTGAATVPPVSARLRELARAAARHNHRELDCVEKHVGDFESCPHPDCSLVRDLAVSPPVETPQEPNR